VTSLPRSAEDLSPNTHHRFSDGVAVHGGFGTQAYHQLLPVMTELVTNKTGKPTSENHVSRLPYFVTVPA